MKRRRIKTRREDKPFSFTFHCGRGTAITIEAANLSGLAMEEAIEVAPYILVAALGEKQGLATMKYIMEQIKIEAAKP
jgi:hypothetical protein